MSEKLFKCPKCGLLHTGGAAKNRFDYRCRACCRADDRRYYHANKLKLIERRQKLRALREAAQGKGRTFTGAMGVWVGMGVE